MSNPPFASSKNVVALDSCRNRYEITAWKSCYTNFTMLRIIVEDSAFDMSSYESERAPWLSQSSQTRPQFSP